MRGERENTGSVPAIFFFSEFYSLAFRRHVDTKKLSDACRVVIKDFFHARGLHESRRRREVGWGSLSYKTFGDNYGL